MISDAIGATRLLTNVFVQHKHCEVTMLWAASELVPAEKTASVVEQAAPRQQRVAGSIRLRSHWCRALDNCLY